MNRPVLRIHRDRARNNIATLRSRLSPSELMVVVKDDAYGHGAGWMAAVAMDEGIRWLGAYDIPTATALRDTIGPAPRVFAWATSAEDEVAEALLSGVDLGVGSLPYLSRVLAQAGRLGIRAQVHLKIDTGLHRNGILPEDWERALVLLGRAEGMGHARLVGVWSHLAEASATEDDRAAAVFREALAAARRHGAHPEVTHLTASAASWERPELRGSLSRVGAFCYGVRSAGGAAPEGIAPIAELIATVTEVRDGRAFAAFGSLDGIPSTLAQKVSVGTPAGSRVLREVGWYESVLDAWPGARAGDQIVVFGRGDQGESSATFLAEQIGTVGEEILTRLSPHVRREHVES